VNRRLVAVLVGGLALVGASSCSTVRPNAAKVGDAEIHRSEFERDMQKLGGSATASIDVVRTGLTDRIRFAAATRAITDQRLTVSDANRTKGEELAKSKWQTYDSLPGDLKTRLRDGFAAEVALAATQPAKADQTVSEALGGQDGTLCLTAIPATSEDDAKTVLADLAAGKTLADVITPRVAGTELEASKGAVLTNSSGDCPTASQFNETIVSALGNVKLNTPSAPVKITSSDGTVSWFIFLPTKAGDGDAQAILAGLKAAAVSVSVDARYGRWDPDTQTVVAGDATDVG
jgi:hypothetical protein